MKRIAYSKSALKTLSRMPANVSAMIRSKIALLADDPAAQANNVKALKGEPGIYRLRVGDWRVLYTDQGEILAVIRVAPGAAPMTDPDEPVGTEVAGTDLRP